MSCNDFLIGFAASENESVRTSPEKTPGFVNADLPKRVGIKKLSGALKVRNLSLGSKVYFL